MFTFDKLVLFIGLFKVTIGDKALQDAHIYAAPNKEGIRIVYSEQPDWSDLDSVLERHGFSDVGSLCVSGS